MSDRPTLTTGQRGEALALAHLTARGYTLVTTNWRCMYGEIDIVAQRAERLTFVEVRTRRSALGIEDALASVTPRKRARMIRAAYTYIAEHNIGDTAWQIDVIAVALPYRGQPVLTHVENALDW